MDGKKKQKRKRTNKKLPDSFDMKYTTEFLPRKRLTKPVVGLFNKGKTSKAVARSDFNSPKTRARNNQDIHGLLNLTQGNEITLVNNETEPKKASLVTPEIIRKCTEVNGRSTPNAVYAELTDITRLELQYAFKTKFIKHFTSKISKAKQERVKPCPLTGYMNRFNKQHRASLLSSSFGHVKPGEADESIYSSPPCPNIEEMSFELNISSSFGRKSSDNVAALFSSLEGEPSTPHNTVSDFTQPMQTPYQHAVREEYLRKWDVISDGLLDNYKELFPDLEYPDPASQVAQVQKPEEEPEQVDRVDQTPQRFFRCRMF